MFDAQRFLKDHFRDADGVVGLLAAYKLRAPEHETARKWFSRGRVPGEWLPLLLCVLELEHGNTAKIAEYIEWRSNDA